MMLNDAGEGGITFIFISLVRAVPKTRQFRFVIFREKESPSLSSVSFFVVILVSLDV